MAEKKIAALELQIKNLKRENYALRVRYTMQGQPPFLNNNHVIMCIGNAIFNFFNVIFVKGGDGKAYIGHGNDNDFATALFHLKAFMVTCKLVRTVICNAIRHNESYFLCYHYLQYQKHIKNTCNEFDSAYKYTIFYLTHNTNKLSGKNRTSLIHSRIYFNWNEYNALKASIECHYNAQTLQHEFFIVVNDQKHMFASLHLPRKLHLFSMNKQYETFLSGIMLQQIDAINALYRMHFCFHPQKTHFSLLNKNYFK